MRYRQVFANGGNTADVFAALNGSLLLQLGTDWRDPSSNSLTKSMQFDPWCPVWSPQSSLKFSTRIAYLELVNGDWVHSSGSLTGVVRPLRTEPVTLTNGLHFDEALVYEMRGTLRTSATYMGHRMSSVATAINTMWLVRGLGRVQETDVLRGTQTVDGRSRPKVSTQTNQLASIPAWSNYLVLDGTTLRINGTAINDVIRMETNGANLAVYRNGVPDSVPMASVTGVVINGLDGNDRIDASHIGVPVTLYGIPFLWSLVGTSAATQLGIREDWGLLVAGVSGTALLVARRVAARQGRGARAAAAPGSRS